MKKFILCLAIVMSSYCSYAQVYDTGNNVGIGIPNPTAKFQIETAGNTDPNGLAVNSNIDAMIIGSNGYGQSAISSRQYDAINQPAAGDTQFLNLFYNGSTYNWYERMRISANGKVGIGTTTPTGLLHLSSADNIDLKIISSAVGGYSRLFFGAGTNGARWNVGQRDDSGGIFSIEGDSNGGGAWSSRLAITLPGNVGIGTPSPGAKLHVQADANTSGAPDNAQFYITGNAASGKRLSLAYNTSSNYDEIQAQAYSGSYSSLTLNPNGGNVLIGKTSEQPGADYKLDIGGSVRADKIVVNTTGADFVFDKQYVLPKLSDVKSYVDQNHHLPEIPSAKEMQTNGLELGEMNKKLLQKVEELTLYAIQQKEENEVLKKENSQLEARMSVIEAALSKVTGKQ